MEVPLCSTQVDLGFQILLSLSIFHAHYARTHTNSNRLRFPFAMRDATKRKHCSSALLQTRPGLHYHASLFPSGSTKVGKVIGIVYRGQIVNGRIAGRQLETNLDGHMITVAVIDEIVPFPRSSDVGDMT